MARKTILAWIQEECGHECEVWSQEMRDGSWALHMRCGCDLCEHNVRKVVSLLYPDIPTTIYQ